MSHKMLYAVSVLPALVVMPTMANCSDNASCHLDKGEFWNVKESMDYAGTLTGDGQVHVAGSQDIDLVLSGDISGFTGIFSGTQYSSGGNPQHPHNYMPAVIFKNWDPEYTFNLSGNGDFIFDAKNSVVKIEEKDQIVGRYFLNNNALSMDSVFATVTGYPCGVYTGGRGGTDTGHVVELNGYQGFDNLTFIIGGANVHSTGDIVATVKDSNLRGLHASGSNTTIDGNVILNVSNTTITERIWGTQTGVVVNGDVIINADNVKAPSLYGQNIAQAKENIDVPAWVNSVTLNVTNGSVIQQLRGLNSSDREAYEQWLETHDQKPDVNIILKDSIVEEELISVGNDLVAGNVVIDVLGNSRIGYTQNSDGTWEKNSSDGWILGGAQKPKSHVDSVVVNLNTQGTDNEIHVAGDVSVGGRESSTTDVDVDSTGVATLNVLGGGNVYTGDLRAYRVAGDAILNISNVTFTPGNITEFNKINITDGAHLISNNNINVADGAVMTIGRGLVTGDGAFTLSDGAVLNLGTATVQQKNTQIDGTVNAIILDSNNFGRLYGDVKFGENAELNLSVVQAGTYKIFDTDNDFAGIDAGALFDVTNNGADGVVISTKSVDVLAADNGLSSQAAATLVGIVNDGNAVASINVQRALVSGDTEYIEQESAKAQPYDVPVVQSVATSVQNQVLALTSARMAGGATGRSGGEFVTTGSGMWAHGMINRSKMNNAFHGDTRGMAVGVDMTFNRKYTFGMGYAHGDTDVKSNVFDTDIESNTLFAYAQYKPSKWFVNGAFNYTFADYSTSANIFGLNITSDYDVKSYGGQIMTGYDFASGVTPSAGVRYLYITHDDYNNGIADVKSDDINFMTGVAGMKYAFDINTIRALTLRPELRAAATYDFVTDDNVATVLMPGAPAYIVNANNLSRMGGEFGIGMTALFGGIELSLNYDLDLHKDYTSQTGMLKFKYNF